jgi:hypothetical protein
MEAVEEHRRPQTPSVIRLVRPQEGERQIARREQTDVGEQAARVGVTGPAMSGA